MSMKKNIVIILLGCLLIPVSAYAVAVKATVDKNRMTMEDILALTVSVSDSDAQVDTSVIKDFRVLSQSSGSSFQWINGKTSHEYTHSYSLAPVRKGALLIPALTLTDKGKTYSTRPIKVLVQDVPVTDQDSRDIMVKAKVNDPFPYVGQQLIYEFTLYYAVRINNPSLSIPDFNDFVVKETDKDSSFTTVINGREYQGIQRRILLIPLKAGTYNIPPSVLNCDKVVQDRRNRRNDPFDMFNDPFFSRSRRERKILRTEPITIEVSQLPANPYDVSFSGLVGQVSVSGRLENDHLKVGDSTTLTLTVQGTGNIMDVEEPEVSIPDGLKMYKDTPEEDISVTENGYKGKKIFRVALVAVKEGDFSIPPVKINVFDVEKGQYELLESPAFSLSVAPSDHPERQLPVSLGPSDNAGSRPLRIKKKVEYTGHDILPVKDSLDGAENKPGLPVGLFTLLLVIPALLAGLVKTVLMYTGRDKSRASIMAGRAEEALKSAGKPGLPDEDYVSCLYRAFTSMVFSKASMSGETLTSSEVEDILGKGGMDKDCMDEAKDLLDRIESTRFSGRTLDESLKKDLMERTRRMIRRLRS